VGLYCGSETGSSAVDGDRLRAPEMLCAERSYFSDRQYRSPMLGSIFGKVRLALDWEVGLRVSVLTMGVAADPSEQVHWAASEIGKFTTIHIHMVNTKVYTGFISTDFRE